MANESSDDNKDNDPILNIQAEQSDNSTHIELDVANAQQSDDSQQHDTKNKEDTKEKDKPFTIAGYEPLELLKAPIKPPKPYKSKDSSK